MENDNNEETEIFKRDNRKFIYKTGKTTDPNFLIAMNEDNEEAIFRIVTRDKQQIFLPAWKKLCILKEQNKLLLVFIGHLVGKKAFL